MSRRWTGHAPAFEIEWGGRTWGLRVDDERPGLRVLGSEAGPLLSLEGVAAVGRWSPEALSGTTLVNVERRSERIEATYAPPDWDELAVRVAWEPSGDDGIDVEVQISTQSVGRLKAVEVRLASVLPELRGSSRPKRWVEPRDARSAALSYDGREADVRGLTTLPPPDQSSPLAPRVLPDALGEGATYIEMVHPHDVSRRITETSKPASLGYTTRYALFGHDLEKGVILRARLRGLWSTSPTAREDALVAFERFVNEPPPLGA